MADQKSDHECASCQGKARQRCSGCQSIHYCSKECQEKDWPCHKWFCSLKYPEKDPKEESVRAILLPVDSPIPQFVEVPCTKYPCTNPNEEIFLGDFCTDRIMRIYKNDTTGDMTVLTVFCRDNFLHDGSNPNQCVAAITNGVNTQRWRGPLLAFRTDDAGPMSSEDPVYVDMEKKDMKEVVAIFLEKRNLELYGGR